MASLRELLAEEGFKHKQFLKGQEQQVKIKKKISASEGVTLPIHICQYQKSLQSFRQNTDKVSTRRESSSFSSKRVSSETDRSKVKSLSKGEEPSIDDAAIKAVISILSGYIGKYKKDVIFREMIREKCNSCLVRRRSGESDNGVFANIEMGMDSVEKLVADQGSVKKDLKMKSLRNSIQLLSIVASLNSKTSRNGSTCGIPNSHLSACAQLYLSIVYKIEKNDRISARHLLQVFCDSPFLARTHLLPDLWDHFFLPHLLHLKVWYHKELEFLSGSQHFEKEKRMKALAKLYNDQIDKGTIQFSLYYKRWLKVGPKAPSVPDVPLPSTPFYAPSRRMSSDSYASHSSTNKNLYKIVFGSSVERHSMDLDTKNKDSIIAWNGQEEKYKDCNYVPTKTRSHRWSSSQKYAASKDELWLGAPKSNYFRFLSCQNKLSECLVNGNRVVRSSSIVSRDDTFVPFSDLGRAISTICSSENLKECEDAIHVIAKTWLESQGNPVIEGCLSKSSVIKGMLEILFASEDEEILELAISILAEIISRNEAHGMVILNSDPQLEIFVRLLRSSSLFLKGAVLLYLMRPKAKQMISIEWVALVLRVLEFGDQMQTLFTVRSIPQKAAMYLLDQLLTGFDEDRNLENASQVVSLGGLSLLVRVFEVGEINEKDNAAKLMCCCIRADGSYRNYLVNNLNKASLLELIVLGIQQKSNRSALALLTELLCLTRRTQIVEFLKGLDNGWDGLKTKHMFLVYLLRVSPEESPLVAAVLLHLDLLEDPLKFSVYREEAVDKIIESLDCQNSKIQEQTAKALLILGGRFSYTGEATAEGWFLQQSGINEGSIHGKDIADVNLNEEEEALENWQRTLVIVLLNSGGKRFLEALSNSIANGIPSLAQSSLFTIAWMNRILHSSGYENSQPAANSKLAAESSSEHAKPQTMHPFLPLEQHIKNSACVSMLYLLDKELIQPLRNPSCDGGELMK